MASAIPTAPGDPGDADHRPGVAVLGCLSDQSTRACTATRPPRRRGRSPASARDGCTSRRQQDEGSRRPSVVGRSHTTDVDRRPQPLRPRGARTAARRRSGHEHERADAGGHRRASRHRSRRELRAGASPRSQDRDALAIARSSRRAFGPEPGDRPTPQASRFFTRYPASPSRPTTHAVNTAYAGASAEQVRDRPPGSSSQSPPPRAGTS